MNEKIELLKKIDIENFVWIIYILIIILSYYSNYVEKKYIIYDDMIAREKYRNLIITIFSIALLIYIYFFIEGLTDVLKLNIYDSESKKHFTNLNFIASTLILIAGIIYLYIALNDKKLEIELAFS